ncbi:MAG: hypothetical protein ACOYMA_20300 [Bacteroidia bacterium]
MKKLILLLSMIAIFTYSSFAQTKKDGTPDLRFKENKTYTAPKQTNTQLQQYNTQPKVHVESYKKENYTEVKEHNRTAPNKTDKDNWSTKPNINPETGKKGTKNPK